jgi:tetratricopeptide (TPR) repeat protein
MQLELSLCYNASPARPVTAWYTTTNDPLTWLELIVQAGWDQSELRCLIVPRSVMDRSPVGVLFIPGNKAASGVSESERIRLANELPQLLPYGEAQPRLFLPVNASLNASVMKSEWAELFALSEQTYVWSPEHGLFAIEQQQLLRVTDLLMPPTSQSDEWTAASAGLALNQRIRSLGPSQEVTAETILDQGRGDIGTQSTEPDKLPPRPNEPGTGLVDKLKQNIAAGFWGTLAQLSNVLKPAASDEVTPATPKSTAAGNLSSQAASGTSSLGILQRLQNWLQEKRQQATNNIEEARHREINRLLHLLQTNPDEGLKFAIPFNSDAPRGLSSPGANLTERTVNFGHGGGSGAADFWDIQAEHQRKLIQSYRELANREIALGRHRRAAYIFANLLGDYLAAARTLVDGGYHREAAVLYRDKLHDIRRAADCLRAGGLLSEAIPIYLELQEYELVGQLYTELDQLEEAREAYENAVRQQVSQGNYLKAAKLQEEQLNDDEAALQTLDQGWQLSTTQQQSCFLRTFEKLGETAEHQRATEYLLSAFLDSDRRRESKNLPLLTTLATTYPYPPLQHLAKDQTLITVSELLQTRQANQTAWETQQLLGALTKLEPADRLLERDTRRYATVLRKATPPPPARLLERPVNRHTLKQLRTYQLPCHDCQAIAADQQHVYIAGYREQEIVLLRMNHQGQIHYPTLKPWRRTPSQQRRIHLTWYQPQHLLVHVLGELPVPYDRVFPATDMFPDEVRVGGFAAQADLTVSLASHQGRGLLALQCINYDEYHVQYYSSLVNQFQKSLAFELPDDLDEDVTPPDHWFIQDLHAHYEYWFVGRASKVYLGQKAIENSWDLTSPFRRFVAAPHNTLFRLACLLEQGCCLLWGYLSNLNQVHLAHDLHEPVGCFTQTGELILAGRNGIEVYTCKQDGVRLIAELKGLQQHPIGVCQLRAAQECLVINQDGSVQVYRWH